MISTRTSPARSALRKNFRRAYRLQHKKGRFHGPSREVILIRGKKLNEAHERAEYRQQQQHKNAISEKVAAQRASELEAIRERTQELHELRLAQEKRGRVRQKKAGARVAQSHTKETSADWLKGQQKSGRRLPSGLKVEPTLPASGHVSDLP